MTTRLGLKGGNAFGAAGYVSDKYVRTYIPPALNRAAASDVMMSNFQRTGENFLRSRVGVLMSGEVV